MGQQRHILWIACAKVGKHKILRLRKENSRRALSNSRAGNFPTESRNYLRLKGFSGRLAGKKILDASLGRDITFRP
jgi:hypothetical protein